MVMKYYSNKGMPKFRPDMDDEFAEDFILTGDDYVQNAIAGGAISRRIIDAQGKINQEKSTY